MTEEYNRFVNFYKTKSIIDYSMIDVTNDQRLDKKHKLMVNFY